MRVRAVGERERKHRREGSGPAAEDEGKHLGCRFPVRSSTCDADAESNAIYRGPGMRRALPYPPYTCGITSSYQRAFEVSALVGAGNSHLSCLIA